MPTPDASTIPVDISLEMSELDFESLVSMHTGWRGFEFDMGRFEHATKNYATEPSPHWLCAYWTDGIWSHVMLMRAYLKALNYDCEVLWDVSSEEYVILCDYGTVPGGSGPLGLDDYARHLRW